MELGLERSRRNPGWSAACRVAGRCDDADVVSLNIGGWFGCFGQGPLDNYTAVTTAGRPSHLTMGPWSHSGLAPRVGDVNFWLEASGDL